MADTHRTRIAAVSKKLKEVHGVLLLSSAPQYLRNRDIHFPYRQNSDFFYLTASQERGLNLMISGSGQCPVLFAPGQDQKRLIWEGRHENPRSIARNIGADLIISDDPAGEILKRLKGCGTLYYQPVPGTLSFETAQHLMQIASHNRTTLPSGFEIADTLLVPLRLHKSREEVTAIRKAAAITSAALEEALPYIAPGVPEHFIQATVDYWFKVYGGQSAFTTITGCGPSSAVLHYERCTRSARKGELMLIDCGAEYECYASDITRVFPVSGFFEGVLGELYDIVLAAQKAAISKVRHGVRVQTVYNAAAKILTEGLVDLGVLKGKSAAHFEKKSFLPYFPHGIGHTLGIDVHDVGNIRGNNDAVLEEGMVITIEPGLYFRKAAGKVPPSGVRIEDDILVTRRGSEVLTSFPKERSEIEEIMAESQSDLLG